MIDRVPHRVEAALADVLPQDIPDEQIARYRERLQ
jgi:hypothetical protein